jgi:hypothetical protein
MRFVIALCLLTAPALAEEVTPAPEAEGFSLMQEGAKLVLRGLMSEMEPALDEMGKALSDMEPALRELGPKFQQLIAMIDDFKNYDAPEMLPNGDIIIRRNAPLLPKPEFAPGPNGEIEL